jgi:MOSC domain-containing protein YiiM
MAELESGLAEIRRAPSEQGVLQMIVCRPQSGARQVVEEAVLDLAQGLVGDNWKERGKPDPERQLTIMNSRAAALVAQQKDRWPLAGDQLYIDIDLSEQNAPAGTRFSIGAAVIEVTPLSHTGCKKFVERFGLDAMKFVNSPIGKQLHLRGVNAKVVQGGVIRVGDAVRRLVYSDLGR